MYLKFRLKSKKIIKKIIFFQKHAFIKKDKKWTKK